LGGSNREKESEMKKKTKKYIEPKQKMDSLTGRTFAVEYAGAAGGNGPLHIRSIEVNQGWILAQPVDVVTGEDRGDRVWISPSHVIVLKFWQPREQDDD
jgi:hypothetical protein